MDYYIFTLQIVQSYNTIIKGIDFDQIELDCQALTYEETKVEFIPGEYCAESKTSNKLELDVKSILCSMCIFNHTESEPPNTESYSETI